VKFVENCWNLLQVSSQQKLFIEQSWRTMGSVAYTPELSKVQSQMSSQGVSQ